MLFSLSISANNKYTITYFTSATSTYILKCLHFIKLSCKIFNSIIVILYYCRNEVK